MLQLLSLLQTHRYWPGAELADRLEVSDRTLRRDVDRLRDLGRSRRGSDQSGEHPQGGRLAGAVGAEERDELAAVHVEVEAADGLEGVLADREVTGQLVGRDHRFAHDPHASEASGQFLS